MSKEDGDDEEEAEMDAEEMDLESVEYDLDEEVADEDEVVEEATVMSKKVADMGAKEPMKGGAADNNESPYTKAPAKTKVEGAGEPVKSKDGSEGAKGESAKDHTPTDNINVDQKQV